MKTKHHGFRDESEESWTQWWVLEPNDLPDEEILYNLGATYSYGGPGRAFYEDGSIKRTKERILVKQSGGLDI